MPMSQEQLRRDFDRNHATPEYYAERNITDIPLFITTGGNTIKTELDDPTNSHVKEIINPEAPVAGDMSPPVNIDNSVSFNNPIDYFMSFINGILDTIGGLFS